MIKTVYTTRSLIGVFVATLSIIATFINIQSGIDFLIIPNIGGIIGGIGLIFDGKIKTTVTYKYKKQK